MQVCCAPSTGTGGLGTTPTLLKSPPVARAGKRLSIKAPPMKPLKDVVASALASLKLEDVEPSSCKLLLNKKELDLNCPVRLANIPATAKLELITGLPLFRSSRRAVYDSCLLKEVIWCHSRAPGMRAGREPRLGVQDANPSSAAAAAPAAPSSAAAAAAAAQPAPQPVVQSVASEPAAQPAQPAAESQAPVPAAPPAAPNTTVPAVPASAPSGSAEAGPSGSQAGGPAVQQDPPAAPAAQEGQHPSVAVFGQEVHVFTREAELAAESEHM